MGQVGHLPYHVLVVHIGYDVCYDLYPRSRAHDKTGEEEERVTSVDFCIGKITREYYL